MIWKQKDPIFFKTMSLLWIFPSIGALAILVIFREGQALAIENIMAGAILMAHVYLVYRWLTSPKGS